MLRCVSSYCSNVLSSNTICIRTVLYTKDAQPILVAGSGTLGWDMVRPPNTISPFENPTGLFRPLTAYDA